MVKKASVPPPPPEWSPSILSTMGISFRQATTGLLVLSLALFAVSGWFWWHSIFMDPKRVLEDMLARSLQTSSVTREVRQKDSQGQVQQFVRLDLSPKPTAQTISKIQQAGQQGPTTVTTETIGTQKQDYIRYKAIDSSGQLKEEAVKNVVGSWGTRESGTRPATFFNEAVIGLVPFGNLSAKDRQTLIKAMNDKKVYNYSTAKRSWQHGRPVMVYDLSISAADLIEVLGEYARLTGFGEQAQLNPEPYKGAPPLKLIMTIDIASRQLSSIKYAESNRAEIYHGSGLAQNINLPNTTIPLNDLQKRLQALQPAR